jgi:hypothetical protein
VICEALDQEPSALRLKHCVTMKRNKSFAPLDRESTRPEITRMSASLLPVAGVFASFQILLFERELELTLTLALLVKGGTTRERRSRPPDLSVRLTNPIRTAILNVS